MGAMIGARASGRGWPRAAGLLGVVLATATSILQPGVLIAVPLLILVGAHGFRGSGLILAALFATIVIALGSRDGVWYAERAWAVLIGGGFLALTMIVPSWSPASRAFGAVAGAAAVAAGVLAVRTDAWGALDATISGNVLATTDSTLARLTTLSGEQPTAAVMGTLRELAETQAQVFPAMVGIASMAALGVAWWIRTRLAGEGDQGLGPLREFRFNDHLVWLLVGGLLLVFAQWGDALARVGSNALVFMTALYMLRGAAVFMFISGGLSLFGFVTVLVGLIIAPPILMGLAALVGLGDTWLDLRSRVGERTV